MLVRRKYNLTSAVQTERMSFYEKVSLDTRKSSSKNLDDMLYLPLMTSRNPKNILISVDSPIVQQHTKPANITTFINTLL